MTRGWATIQKGTLVDVLVRRGRTIKGGQVWKAETESSPSSRYPINTVSQPFLILSERAGGLSLSRSSSSITKIYATSFRFNLHPGLHGIYCKSTRRSLIRGWLKSASCVLEIDWFEHGKQSCQAALGLQCNFSLQPPFCKPLLCYCRYLNIMRPVWLESLFVPCLSFMIRASASEHGLTMDTDAEY